jgi:hypothetical protein
MLASLFARIRPLRIVDAVFGSLRFQRVGFWEGRVTFAPTQSEVEVLLDGNRSGPTEAQRLFFTELSARFRGILPTLVKTMREELASYQGPPRQGQAESFSLVCIGLPADVSASSSCELSFEDAAGFHYTVPVRGWAPGAVEFKPC